MLWHSLHSLVPLKDFDRWSQKLPWSIKLHCRTLTNMFVLLDPVKCQNFVTLNHQHRTCLDFMNLLNVKYLPFLTAYYSDSCRVVSGVFMSFLINWNYHPQWAVCSDDFLFPYLVQKHGFLTYPFYSLALTRYCCTWNPFSK